MIYHDYQQFSSRFFVLDLDEDEAKFPEKEENRCDLCWVKENSSRDRSLKSSRCNRMVAKAESI